MLFSFRKSLNGNQERVWPLIIVIWWFTIVLAILLGYCAQLDHELARHCVVTEATITGFHPDDHNRMVIEYTVAGVTYAPLIANMSDPSAPSGKIRVFYDSRDPRNFATSDPRISTEQKMTEVFSTFVFGLLATGLVLLYTFVRKRLPNLPPVLR